MERHVGFRPVPQGASAVSKTPSPCAFLYEIAPVSVSIDAEPALKQQTRDIRKRTDSSRAHSVGKIPFLPDLNV